MRKNGIYYCVCHIFFVTLHPKLFYYTMSSTKAQLIEELKVLLEQDVTAVKDQVEHIKTLFYKDSAEAQDAENESEEFAALEEQFKAIMAEYKAKKAEAAAKAAKAVR